MEIITGPDGKQYEKHVEMWEYEGRQVPMEIHFPLDPEFRERFLDAMAELAWMFYQSQKQNPQPPIVEKPATTRKRKAK